MDTMMRQSSDFVGAPRSDFEAWRAFLPSSSGGEADVPEPDAFAGWVRRRSIAGRCWDTGQPLSENAYACGFRDYAHFARKFLPRFGYSPGAHAGSCRRTDGPVRASTGNSASWAHDL
jgi:AraC-like DNA-binding protein